MIVVFFVCWDGVVLNDADEATVGGQCWYFRSWRNRVGGMFMLLMLLLSW